MEESEIKERLQAADPEFRRLSEDHQRLDSRLAELASRPFLSETDMLLEKDLKKQKLVLKDKMYAIMTAFLKSI